MLVGENENDGGFSNLSTTSYHFTFPRPGSRFCTSLFVRCTLEELCRNLLFTHSLTWQFSSNDLLKGIAFAISFLGYIALVLS